MSYRDGANRFATDFPLGPNPVNGVLAQIRVKTHLIRSRQRDSTSEESSLTILLVANGVSELNVEEYETATTKGSNTKTSCFSRSSHRGQEHTPKHLRRAMPVRPEKSPKISLYARSPMLQKRRTRQHANHSRSFSSLVFWNGTCPSHCRADIDPNVVQEES